MLTFFTDGRPAPQGSKRHVGGGRFIEASKYLPAWRLAVTQCAIYEATLTGHETITGPVELEVVFYLERPKTVTETVRPEPTVPPDLDKLIRGVCDALTDAAVFEDDAQVVKLVVFKRYATAETGAFIRVARLGEN